MQSFIMGESAMELVLVVVVAVVERGEIKANNFNLFRVSQPASQPASKPMRQRLQQQQQQQQQQQDWSRSELNVSMLNEDS